MKMKPITYKPKTLPTKLKVTPELVVMYHGFKIVPIKRLEIRND